MQRLIFVLSIATLVLATSACGSSGTPTPVVVHDEEPHLQEFQIVDSYGASASPVYTPILDPYIDGGLFEVYWNAQSFYDYWVTVSINDRPTMADSIILSEELCGYNHSCDYDGMQLCAYDSDYYMGCGADLYEAESNMTDIIELIPVVDVPTGLYLNIEVCDESGWLCEVISRPVTAY